MTITQSLPEWRLLPLEDNIVDRYIKINLSASTVSVSDLPMRVIAAQIAFYLHWMKLR
jgi:hypothetical protein